MTPDFPALALALRAAADAIDGGPVLPPQPHPPAPRRVLTPADFAVAGVYTLPTDKTTSLPWTNGQPALLLQGGGYPAIRRKADGSKTFIFHGCRAAGQFGVVCEVSLSVSGRGTLVNTWTPQQFFGGVVMPDMAGDFRGQHARQLWMVDASTCLWLYVPFYNVTANDSHTVIGLTTIAQDGTATPRGTFSIAGGVRKCSTYFCSIPAWFQPFVGGRTLAVGAVADSNGNVNCSYGPSLIAIDMPTAATPPGTVLGSVPIVNYPRGHEVIRGDGTAVLSADSGLNVSTWCEQDAVQAAVWIDRPDAHGFLAFGRECMGHIWYGTSPYGPPDGKRPEYLPPNAQPRDPLSDSKGAHADDYRQCWWGMDPGLFQWSLHPTYYPNPAPTFPMLDKYQIPYGAVVDDDGSIYLSFTEKLDAYNWLPMLVRLTPK